MRRSAPRLLQLVLMSVMTVMLTISAPGVSHGAYSSFATYQCGGFNEMAPPPTNLYSQNPIEAFAFSRQKYNTNHRLSSLVSGGLSPAYAYNYQVPMLINCNPATYGVAGRGYTLSSATAVAGGSSGTPSGANAFIDFASPAGTRVTSMWVRRRYHSTGGGSSPYSWTARIQQLIDHDGNGDGYLDEHPTPLDNVCGVRSGRPNHCEADLGTRDGEATFTNLQPNARGLRMRLDCLPQSGTTCPLDSEAKLQLLEVRLWIEDATTIDVSAGSNWNPGCWYNVHAQTAQPGCVNLAGGFRLTGNASRPSTGVYDLGFAFSGNPSWIHRVGGESFCTGMLTNQPNDQDPGSQRYWFLRSPLGCAVTPSGAPNPTASAEVTLPIPANIPSGAHRAYLFGFAAPSSMTAENASQSPYPSSVYSASDGPAERFLHIDNTPMSAHGSLSNYPGGCNVTGLGTPTASRTHTSGGHLWAAGTASIPLWACDEHSGVALLVLQTTTGSADLAEGPNPSGWAAQCTYMDAPAGSQIGQTCQVDTVAQNIGTTAATEGQWLWARVAAVDNANNTTFTDAFPLMRIDNVGPRRPSTGFTFEALDPPVSGIKRAFTDTGGTGWTNSLRVRASWGAWQDALGAVSDVFTYVPGVTHSPCPVAERRLENRTTGGGPGGSRGGLGSGSIELPQDPQAECRQGGHQLSLRMADALGNNGETITGTFNYDSAPGSDSRNAVWGSLTDSDIRLTPQALNTPDGWSTTNSFDVSWRNPTPTTPGRVAPLAAAHYRIGDGAWQRITAPASCVTWGATCSLSGLSVNAPGTHKFEVYLEDAAGNFDRAQSATGSLRLADNSCVIPDS